MENTNFMRKLKVYAIFSFPKFKKSYTNPQIRLSGVWLKKAGFRPGDHISVMAKDGKIFIEKRE